ncbi:MAG TPA: hypothetical protein VIH60_04135 [Steroidobacteraceae bacterium]|jgi:hypothetical protein
MRFRLKAFGLHLAGSTCALSVILGGMYLGWYRGPGWYLSGVARVVVVLGLVDVCLGPTLTLIIANPRKPRRLFVRDIGTIVAVQIVALAYGAMTVWQGRPLYYTFSVDRLEMVQASDLKPEQIALAQRQNPALAPHWYSRPRWIWAPLPEDPQEQAKIVNGALFGGDDVIQMPRYFKPWNQALPQLRTKLQAVGDMHDLNKREKADLTARVSALGLAPVQKNAMILWGGTRQELVVFDVNSLRISAILRVD